MIKIKKFINENKNILNSDIFQYGVNAIINSLEADNYNQDLSKYNQSEVKMGLEVEQEHTSDPKELYKIVADHLEEDPAYYSKMKKAGFNESINNFYKNIKEGRSGNRWLSSLSKSFADYTLNYFKNNPNMINKPRIIIPKNQFLEGYDQKILKKLKRVSIFIEKAEDVANLIFIKGASYTDKEAVGTYSTIVGDVSFERGEIDIKIKVDNSIKDFNDLSQKYSYIYSELQTLYRHELEHFIDDFTTGIKRPEENLSPFKFISDEQKEEFDYLVRDYEVKAYVEQTMDDARRERIPFLKALKRLLFSRPEFSDYVEDPRLKKLIYVLMYEYLQYASSKFNSVREDPDAMSYLNKLDSYLSTNNLHLYRNISEGKTKLSKYWNKRAKSRAKRAGRHFPNNKDKQWAQEQEEKSKDIGSTLKKAFEEEIKETEEISKKISEIVSFASKNKFRGKDPFVSGITGRAKGFKQKHKGKVKVAPGESFGPLEEEEE